VHFFRETTVYDPIVQYLGIVSRAENPEAARKFADFLLRDEGRKMLGSFGFVPAERSQGEGRTSQ
jgi:ABC-type molybdate transport system substrate-binding protein